jgi:hypothetical protein
MFRWFKRWLNHEIKTMAGQHNIGLFRQAFAQRGYPVDAFTDMDIERAIHAMWQAIGEASMERDAELKAGSSYKHRT